MGAMMTNEQASIQNNEEQNISLRTQRILEYLAEQWQDIQEPSGETLKRVAEFVVGLPEEYKVKGLTAIGNYLANNLILHFLDIMVIFWQKAEQEGIDLEEREQYLNYVLTELFPKMVGLNRAIFIESLDELAALSNITLSLQTLSHADTAVEAQSWMYELPKIYPCELAQENLVTKAQEDVVVNTLDGDRSKNCR